LKLSILLDQNVVLEALGFLRERRPEWTVQHTRELGLNRATDIQVFEWAQRTGAIVVTFDEDFADARTFPLGTHAGIVRLRVWPTSPKRTLETLARLMDNVPDEEWPCALIIIDETRIRIRRLHGNVSQ